MRTNNSTTTMESPPGFLRAVVDGAFEAAVIVLSNGIIWHMNEPSRRMFRVTADGTPTHVSTYLSFCSSFDLFLTAIPWEDLTSGELPTNEKWTAPGIGRPTSGENIHLKINFVKVPSPDERREYCYYILYMQQVVDDREILAGIMDACKISLYCCISSLSSMMINNLPLYSYSYCSSF
jgi:hypothetical protein